MGVAGAGGGGGDDPPLTSGEEGPSLSTVVGKAPPAGARRDRNPEGETWTST